METKTAKTMTKEYTPTQKAVMDAIKVMVVAVVTSGRDTDKVLRDAADMILHEHGIDRNDLIEHTSRITP